VPLALQNIKAHRAGKCRFMSENKKAFFSDKQKSWLIGLLSLTTVFALVLATVPREPNYTNAAGWSGGWLSWFTSKTGTGPTASAITPYLSTSTRSTISCPDTAFPSNQISAMNVLTPNERTTELYIPDEYRGGTLSLGPVLFGYYTARGLVQLSGRTVSFHPELLTPTSTTSDMLYIRVYGSGWTYTSSAGTARNCELHGRVVVRMY
jgi:hypothetical protein